MMRVDVTGCTAPRRSLFAQAAGTRLERRTRMPELDAVRGIAALAVVCFHMLSWGPVAEAIAPPALSAAFRAGWLGVDVFFVLSGFLITGILLDDASSPSYYRDFYIKRALRILPLYYVSAFMSLAIVT